MRSESAPELVSALEDAQRLGFLGARPIPEVIDHARGFVRVLERYGTIRSVLDLGSGAGVPGLIIAHDLPGTHVTLLDRRAKRTDVLERVVRRLGWHDRVSVVCRNVEAFAPAVGFDAVVARGFGPPVFTLSHAARLVRPGSPIVISEPPGENRWDTDLLADLHLHQVPSPMHRNTAHRAATGSQATLDGLVATFIKD